MIAPGAIPTAPRVHDLDKRAPSESLDALLQRPLIGLFGAGALARFSVQLSKCPPFRVPLLIAFGITIVFYWIAGFYWIVFGAGAEELAAHPGILMGSPRDPSTIKPYPRWGILVVSYLVSVALPPILR
jgi:hypothetical protein